MRRLDRIPNDVPHSRARILSGEAFAPRARKSGAALLGSTTLQRSSTEATRRAPRVRDKIGGDRFSHYVGRSLAVIAPLLFATIAIGVLLVAWLKRDEGHLTAESGPGYWLGVAGASIMLVLLLYPLRKRLKIMHGLGRVAGWFRLHMMLGIIGPVLIVLHSNFKLGSLNRSLALMTMLTVVTSGIVGRYLYGKVHKGLYGSQLQIREIGEDFSALEEFIGNNFARDPEVKARLHTLSKIMTTTPTSFLAALRLAIFCGTHIRQVRRFVRPRARAAALQSARANGLSRTERRAHIKAADQMLEIYFSAARKAGRLALFERMLSLWHAFHLPLFVLLGLTTGIHIVAVHLY